MSIDGTPLKMGLYLCIHTEDGDDEIAGWQFGTYSDFGKFRDTIAEKLDATHFPLLMQHSDCDGEWTVTELPQLVDELRSIAAALRKLPPRRTHDESAELSQDRANARSLHDCFHNVDGENVFDALIDLCEQGIKFDRPISFE